MTAAKIADFQELLIPAEPEHCEQLAALQASRAGWKRNTVESADEKRLRLAQQRMAAKAPASARARVASMSAAQLAQEKRRFEMNLNKLVAMGVLKPKLAGQADMGLVSRLVKQALAG